MDSQEQFTRLWTEAQPKLAAYLNALVPDFQEAEDLLQEVAVVLLRKFPECDPQRPFIGWAIGIAKREVLMARRRYARNFLCYQTELLERISEAYEELAPELDDRSRALRDCLPLIKGWAVNYASPRAGWRRFDSMCPGHMAWAERWHPGGGFDRAAPIHRSSRW